MVTEDLKDLIFEKDIVDDEIIDFRNKLIITMYKAMNPGWVSKDLDIIVRYYEHMSIEELIEKGVKNGLEWHVSANCPEEFTGE